MLPPSPMLMLFHYISVQTDLVAVINRRSLAQLLRGRVYNVSKREYLVYPASESYEGCSQQYLTNLTIS